MNSDAIAATSAVLPAFDPPAQQQDFPNSPAQQQAFNQQWSQYIAGATQTAIQGNPWSSLNDQDRTYYFNPLITAIPGGTGVLPIPWGAFPNRILIGFGPGSKYNLTQPQLVQLADQGFLADVPAFQNGFPIIPPYCPTIDWSSPMSSWTPYTPTGPRGWLDEYCEFAVTRDTSKKIIKITFTCENPEYWFTMWRIDPGAVLAAYQTYINPAVQLHDLCVTDACGRPLIDPVSGAPAYNPLNKWNSGTQALSDQGGAMHLTSPPNTLGAEIYLGAAASIARTDAVSGNAATLICCTHYGRPYRNSDPHIGFVVNQNTYNPPGSFVATLANPVGLYIQSPTQTNWNAYTMPAGSDGYTAQDCWKVVRGRTAAQAGAGYDQILRVEFSMPPALAANGLTVSDIQIGGVSIQYASQIQQTFNMTLGAMVIPTTQPVQAQQACPADNPNPTPQVQTLFGAALYAAYNQLPGGFPAVLPPSIAQGRTVSRLTLVVANATAETTFVFPGGGIEMTVQRPQAIDDKGTYQYSVSVSVGAGAPLGPTSLQAINPGQPPGPAQPNVLTVAPAQPGTTHGGPPQPHHQHVRRAR